MGDRPATIWIAGRTIRPSARATGSDLHLGRGAWTSLLLARSALGAAFWWSPEKGAAAGPSRTAIRCASCGIGVSTNSFVHGGLFAAWSEKFAASLRLTVKSMLC